MGVGRGRGHFWGLPGGPVPARQVQVRFAVARGAAGRGRTGGDGEQRRERVRWRGEQVAFSSFVNWEIFPSPKFPVLVYFKETQTKPEGQVHFFPIIFSFDELYPVRSSAAGRARI